MRVLHVAAEIYPLVKTGGLADVTAALPPALAQRGIDVRVLLPGLPAIRQGLGPLTEIVRCGPAFGAGAVRVLLGRLPDSHLDALVIDAPYLYDRPGNPYLDVNGRPWADNHRRFALLGWVAAQIAAGGLIPDWQPDIVHAHDWHAGLAAAYLAMRPGPRPGTVFTIHNLAYQGLFDASTFGELGLPAPCYAMDGLEFHGQVSFMKAALTWSDRITTVSPGYAREIRNASAGWGLEGLVRQRAEVLSGILNGVDYGIWDPSVDRLIAAHYDRSDLRGKAACREQLRREFDLDSRADTPIFCVVSRLTEQKGLDLVLGALDSLLLQGAQLVLLGSGDDYLEAAFRTAAVRHRGQVAVRIGYDEDLAHRIIAGSDVILVPSRFEPCGLTQLYGLRYGTLPLVRRVGGLADTVVDANAANIANGSATGFVFDAASPGALAETVNRALSAWREPSRWQSMMANAMSRSFSWEDAAASYDALYRNLRP